MERTEPLPAWQHLTLLARLVGHLGREAREETFDQIAKVGERLSKTLYLLSDRVPHAVSETVSSAAVEFVRQFGSPGEMRELEELLFDPRSPTEISRQLEQLSRWFEGSPELDSSFGMVLERLEHDGLLGISTLSSLGRFLSSVRLRGGPVWLSDVHRYRAGDQEISLDVLEDYLQAYTESVDEQVAVVVQEIARSRQPRSSALV